MKLRRAGFTLIELLVVIAITAILMTLIVLPLVQSFNLTRSAQAWAEAQDKARTLTERIAHEVNHARYVRDNTGARGRLDIVVTSPNGGTLLGYDTSARMVRMPIYNAKLDLIRPSEGDPSLMANGAFVNPRTGLADPTLKGPEGQVNLPNTPGLTLVRYFIGLRNPLRRADNLTGLAGYIEPYTGLLQPRSASRDNLYVLYRVEVPVMIWSPTQQRYVVNKRFFYDLGRNTNTGQTGAYVDDPMFFDPTADPGNLYYTPSGPNNMDSTPNYDIPDPDPIPDPTKAEMIQNWLNEAVIQTEVSRFDMIQPIYNTTNRQVTFDGPNPRLMTLIQFRPTRVSDEPAQGQEAIRLNEESDSASALAPDVYLTKYGGWSNAVLSWFPPGHDRDEAYEVGLPSADAKGYNVWLWNPTVDGYTPLPNSVPNGYMLLDDSYYRDSLRNGIRAGLSRAMAAANAFDVGSGRGSWLNDATMRSNFVAFFGDPDRGRARTSYSITEIGDVSGANFMPVALPDPTNNPNNLPGNVTWPDSTPPLTPFNDPNLAVGTFSDPAYSSINRKFNKLWRDYPALHGNIHRFIDLRVTPNSDGASSPLHPDPLQGFARAYIVPGSEQVFGPDQNPGSNYGHIVRYWRTTREPGPNQYRINYTDLPEPDYSLLGVPAPPANYTPTDLTSAIIQPRYKAGYIQFNSDPNVPLPGDDPATASVNEANILVFYRFQFTRPEDALMVNYDSRQLMSVQVTIRNYPQSSLPNPQSVTLQSTASVRNFLR